MNVIKEIYLGQRRHDEPISVTYGRTAIGIELHFMDYEIPSGSTASVYAHPKGTDRYYKNKSAVTVSADKIVFRPDGGLFEPGENDLQIKLAVSGGDVLTFLIKVLCDPDLSAGGDYSDPESIVSAADRAEAVLASIPTDYTAMSNTVNNSSLIYRGSLTSSADMDTLLNMGVYFKDAGVVVGHGYNDRRAKIIVFQPANYAWGLVQMWFDTSNTRMAWRSRSSNSTASTAWSAWQVVPNTTTIEDTVAGFALTIRASLAAGTDVDTVTAPGVYFKDGGVYVENGVNTSRARLIVFNQSGSTYGLAQMWVDTSTNFVFSRTKNSPGANWSRWTMLGANSGVADLIPMTDELPNTVEQVYALWDGLYSRYSSSGKVSKRKIGTADGIDVWVYRVDFSPKAMGHKADTTGSYWLIPSDDLYERKKVLVTPSIHGDEPIPVIATYQMFKAALESDSCGEIKGMVFDVLPMANPWGFSHSVVDGNGDPVSGYRNYVEQYLPDGYKVEPHTPDWRGGGIRYDSHGYDLNRDFCDFEYNISYSSESYNLPGGESKTVRYGFKSEMAPLIRDMMDSVGYDMVLDFHMGGGIGDVTKTSDICGFVNFNACPTGKTESEYTALKRDLFESVAKAGYALVKNLNAYYSATSRNGFYCWDNLAGSIGHISNYSAGTSVNTGHRSHLTKFSPCLELSQWCYPYSGSTVTNNEGTNHVGINFLASMLNRLVEHL